MYYTVEVLVFDSSVGFSIWTPIAMFCHICDAILFSDAYRLMYHSKSRITESFIEEEQGK